MAADGVLNFNTKIDADGFVKGTKELSSKMVDLKNKISQTENEIAGLQKDLEKLENTNIKSKAMESLEKQADKAKSKLNSLYAEADRISSAKAADLSSMGFDNKYIDDVLARDDSWQKIQKQIGEAEVALHRYERELKSAKAAENQTTGADTAEYAKKKQKLDELTGKLNVYKAKLNETEAEEREASKQTGYTVEYFQKLAKALKETAAKLGKIAKANIANALKKTGSALKAITGHTRKTNAQMGLLEKSLNRIKQAIAGMLLYKILQGGLNSLKEGIDNLAKACPIANKNLSALVTSLTYLKNSLASAFSPILTVVTPILTKFMDTISAAANKVGQFIATLTGQSTYQQAIKVQQDYADSLDTSTKATEKNTQATAENQKNLAGYDELNVMQQEENSGSITVDSGAGEVTYFQTVPTIFSDFAEQLKQAFKKGDFTAIGQLVADKLNKAMSNIKWTKIRNTAKLWASNIAGFLNGAVEKLDWYLTGTTIGNGIMTTVDFGYTFLTKFDFLKFGKGLAKGLNGAIKSIDWRKLGNTLGGFVQSFISTGFGFVSKFDWKSFGKAISDGINGFFEKINWKQAGQAVSKGAKGAFSAISTALKNVNWKQIGKDIADFLTNIDWWGILESAGEAIWDALTGLLSFFSGISGKNNLSKTLDNLAKSFKELVKVAWDKLKSAYKNVLKPLADWIIDKAAPVILKALAEALKIFANIAKKIPLSLLAGITGAIAGMVTAIKAFKAAKDFKKYIDTIIKSFDKLKTVIINHPFAASIAAIATAVLAVVSAIKAYSEEKWSNSSLKSEIEKTAKLTDEWNDLSDGMSTKIEEINDTELSMKVDFENVDKMREKLQAIIEDGTIDESERGEYETIVDLLSEKVDGFEENWNQVNLEEINGELVIKDNVDEVTQKLDDLVESWEIAQAKMTFSEMYSSLQTDAKKAAVELDKLADIDKTGETKKEFVDYIFENSALSRKESQVLADEIIKANGNLKKAEKALSKYAGVSELSGLSGISTYGIRSVLHGSDWQDIEEHMKEYADTFIEHNEAVKDAEYNLKYLKNASDEYYSALCTLNDGSKNYNDYIKLSTDYGLSHDAVLSLLKDDGITTWGELEKAAERSSSSTENSTRKSSESIEKNTGIMKRESDEWVDVSKSDSEEIGSNYESGFGRITKACSDAWSAIKSIFSDGSGFEQIKTAIWDVFKNALNGLIDGINNVIKQPFDAINDVLSGLRTCDFWGTKLFDWIPEINAPQIPKLATGAYVPANYGQFLAILGDNKREGELVAPESKFEQLIDRAMEKYGVNNTGGDIHITLTVGEDVLGTTIVKWNDKYKKRHGVSALM